MPVANAGTNQIVSKGSFVTLNGIGSFASTSGATITAYSWVQTSGILVQLTGANPATATFTAPTNSTIDIFSLTVTDSNGLTSVASTTSVSVQ